MIAIPPNQPERMSVRLLLYSVKRAKGLAPGASSTAVEPEAKAFRLMSWGSTCLMRRVYCLTGLGAFDPFRRGGDACFVKRFNGEVIGARTVHAAENVFV